MTDYSVSFLTSYGGSIPKCPWTRFKCKAFSFFILNFCSQFDLWLELVPLLFSILTGATTEPEGKRKRRGKVVCVCLERKILREKEIIGNYREVKIVRRIKKRARERETRRAEKEEEEEEEDIKRKGGRKRQERIQHEEGKGYRKVCE